MTTQDINTTPCVWATCMEWNLANSALHPVLPLLFMQKERKKNANFRNTCAIFCLFTLLLIRGGWLDKPQTFFFFFYTWSCPRVAWRWRPKKRRKKKSKRLMLMLKPVNPANVVLKVNGSWLVELTSNTARSEVQCHSLKNVTFKK